MLGMVIYQSLAYYAAHMTSATHMGLIGSLTPMMGLGLSTAMLGQALSRGAVLGCVLGIAGVALVGSSGQPATLDRKSTRLNSSHLVISIAVFCLKKYWNSSTRYFCNSIGTITSSMSSVLSDPSINGSRPLTQSSSCR